MITNEEQERILLSNHTFRPDIFTASAEYATRFAGEVGAYFLDIQEKLVLELLEKDRSGNKQETLRILEVGGGHAQLTESLLRCGHEVVVHGSDEKFIQRLKHLQASYGTQLSTLVSPIELFKPKKGEFDVVVAVRVMAHVRDWREFLGRIAEGANKQVIVDIASLLSFSILTPVLFPIKKMLEGNTREYFCHFPCSIGKFLEEKGFKSVSVSKEFFFPMGFHRTIGRAEWSRTLENMALQLRLTGLFGSPCLISGKRY